MSVELMRLLKLQSITKEKKILLVKSNHRHNEGACGKTFSHLSSLTVTEVIPGCMEGLLSSYSGPIRPSQQQLVTPEHNCYNADPFQQGLTPPQMPGDHMNPYGERHTV